ncbi:hypothetical protein F8S13_15140 [Chloroflexia bacterium SDU3-3]|nr:hypothetical protein F8S13_15140 [Chloroflexia bacterium SDU3-3]
MDRQTIIAMLGEEVYASEGAAARRAAPHTGYRGPPYAYASTVPEEIGALVWATPEAELDAQGKIRLLFACYRDIPDYAWLSDLAVFHYDDFSPASALSSGQKCKPCSP